MFESSRLVKDDFINHGAEYEKINYICSRKMRLRANGSGKDPIKILWAFIVLGWGGGGSSRQWIWSL